MDSTGRDTKYNLATDAGRWRELTRLKVESEKLAARYLAWCVQRGAPHAYETEARTVADLIAEFVQEAKSVELTHGVRSTLAPFALCVLARRLRELRQTIEKVEADELHRTKLNGVTPLQALTPYYKKGGR